MVAIGRKEARKGGSEGVSEHGRGRRSGCNTKTSERRNRMELLAARASGGREGGKLERSFLLRSKQSVSGKRIRSQRARWLISGRNFNYRTIRREWQGGGSGRDDGEINRIKWRRQKKRRRRDVLLKKDAGSLKKPLLSLLVFIIIIIT